MSRLVATLAAVVVGSSVLAQPSARRATNLSALLNYPAFYQMRPVVLVGTVALRDNGRIQVTDETGSLQVIFKGTPPDGLAEIRGEFWDLGRMNADDPRLATLDVRTMFGIDPETPWPRPGQVLAVMATAMTPVTPPGVPSVRSMVLFPARYREQKVTIVGQFAGRNLLGDLPDAPARSRYDFVLRSADAAIWVANMRPRLRDANGKEFELALDSRLDSSRWLSIRGTVQQGRGLLWIDAEAGSLALAKPPTETANEEEPVRVPAGPPPEVVFSAPTEDETDVLLATNVRIQFSRDIDQTTLKGRIRVRYLDSQTVERGEPVTPTADFTFQYTGANRMLELRFAKPLERFRTIKVDLLEGIIGTDGQPLKPWTLTFALGGA